MRSFAATAFLFLCPVTFPLASVAQTKSPKIQPPAYEDFDGYQVLSYIIDARTNKLKNESISIFHQTLSEQAFRDLRSQCSGTFPEEFQTAVEDFDKKAKTKFLLQRRFSIRKQYGLVVMSVPTRPGAYPGVYAMSAVGFDEGRTRAIVLIEYLVRLDRDLVVGGDSTFYLLRRTEKGWQEVAGTPKCGRIY